jgi:hypothetical protein
MLYLPHYVFCRRLFSQLPSCFSSRHEIWPVLLGVFPYAPNNIYSKDFFSLIATWIVTLLLLISFLRSTSRVVRNWCPTSVKTGFGSAARVGPFRAVHYRVRRVPLRRELGQTTQTEHNQSDCCSIIMTTFCVCCNFQHLSNGHQIASQTQALLSRHGRSNSRVGRANKSSRGQDQTQDSNSDEDDEEMECWYCLRKGHTESLCKIKKKAKRKRKQRQKRQDNKAKASLAVPNIFWCYNAMMITKKH